MKTANEWQNEYWKLRNNPPPKVAGKTPSMNEWEILVKQIQLDALKEGMQIVMKIVGQHNTAWDKDTRQALLELSEIYERAS